MRDAIKDDSNRLMQIYEEAFPQAHPAIPDECWRGHFGTLRMILESWKTFVAEKNGSTIGFVALVDEHITDFYVLPAAQGQGFGTKLMRRIKECRPALTLEVFANNSNAVSFYSKEGFVVESEYEEPCSKQRKLRMKWPNEGDV